MELAEPSADDLETARAVVDAQPFERETYVYVIAAMLATERREAANMVRAFAARVGARVIALDGRPLEQAQALRNAPEALRALADGVEA